MDIQKVASTGTAVAVLGGGSLLGSFTDPRTYGIEFGAKF